MLVSYSGEEARLSSDWDYWLASARWQEAMMEPLIRTMRSLLSDPHPTNLSILLFVCPVVFRSVFLPDDYLDLPPPHIFSRSIF